MLAAKNTLAQAAQARGWHVRTAETIGMAQRGGSVESVRMGNEGEHVALAARGCGCGRHFIAFEPGGGARMLLGFDAQACFSSCRNEAARHRSGCRKNGASAAPVLEALERRGGRKLSSTNRRPS